MNGVHDIGGMDGFMLPERDQDFPLREEWEREFWGARFALFAVPNSGGGLRQTIERMPPDQYLSLPYFAKWLWATEQLLIRNGIVTADELANPNGPVRIPDRLADFRPATPDEIIAQVERDASTQLDFDVAPRFAVGDTVRAKNLHPEGHTRMPRYVRGHVGTIATQHGVHVFPDALPLDVDIDPQNLYTVGFSARELWGDRGHANDVIHVELWEYHLEPA